MEKLTHVQLDWRRPNANYNSEMACIIDLGSKLWCGGRLFQDGGADDMDIFSREGIS